MTYNIAKQLVYWEGKPAYIHWGFVGGTNIRIYVVPKEDKYSSCASSCCEDVYSEIEVYASMDIDLTNTVVDVVLDQLTGLSRDDKKKCARCKGSGTVVGGGRWKVNVECPECEGEGYL